MAGAAAGLLLSIGLLLRAGAVAAQELAAPPADAYRDEQARELVRLARARRATVDTRITSYQVTARSRLSARMGAAGVDRLLFRRESVSRVEWRPDTVRIELLGAREAEPLIGTEVQRASPTVAAAMPALAFDPADSEMLLRADSTTVRHPLGAGAEAYYRYASGDSASFRLPDGRTVRLVELRISARRADPHLISGSFWLDAQTHAVVRAALRPSAPVTASRRGLSLLLPEITARIDDIGIEYGLVDLRWWLPRLVVGSGSARVGGLRFAMDYERRYEAYRVTGDTLAPPPALAEAADPRAEDSRADDPRRCRPRMAVSITIGAAPSAAVWDSVFRSTALRMAHPDSATAGTPRCERVFVVSHAPEAELTRSRAFTTGIYDEGERVSGSAERRALTALAGRIPGAPWTISPPSLQLVPVDLLRFNRVEGLSAGARASLALGAAELRGELRVGTTGEVGARLAAARSGAGARLELAGYRELRAVEIASRPFSLTSSASALLLGRDENDYFRATGVELRLAPPAARLQDWDLRLFAERQAPVSARAGGSLRGVLDDGFTVRDNLVADRLSQIGARLSLRSSGGDDPRRPRLRTATELLGETGDSTFLRLLVRSGVEWPLGRRVAVSLEAAGGSAYGAVPAQAVWQIGGAATVRGQDPAAARGRELGLGRAELLVGPPGLRLAVFGDVGAVGRPAAGAAGRKTLGGAGLGIVAFGNLLRFDVARGIGGGGYRGYLRVGGGP